MKIFRAQVITGAFVLAFALNSYADGLDTLIDVARSQGEIQKVLNEETKAFERVKRGIDSGAIKKGTQKEEIRKKCGEPVVAVEPYNERPEKWIYKPATSSHFSGPKISLFFDSGGLLSEIKKVK